MSFVYTLFRPERRASRERNVGFFSAVDHGQETAIDHGWGLCRSDRKTPLHYWAALKTTSGRMKSCNVLAGVLISAGHSLSNHVVSRDS